MIPPIPGPLGKNGYTQHNSIQSEKERERIEELEAIAIRLECAYADLSSIREYFENS